MLEILLIRHGLTDWNLTRRIMGDEPVPINAVGRRQARHLAKILTPIKLRAVYSSPLRRALDTAKIIARPHRLRILEEPAVAEIDYGDWVGRTFDEVSQDPAYRIYHTSPSRARAPGGEAMREVARRAIRFVEKLRRRYRKGRVAVVSHADVIKTILVQYLRLSLDDLLRIRIDNGTVSSLYFNGSHCRVLGLNAHPALAGLFSRTDQLLPLPRIRRPKRGVRRCD